MLCYVMLCYVMLCYVMLCYVMLCYIMLFGRRDVKVDLYDLVNFDHFWPSDWRGNRDEF